MTVDAPNRDRIASAVEAFNNRLASDSLAIGESRGGGYRVAFLPLLMVYFHVDDMTHQVRVTDISRYGR